MGLKKHHKWVIGGFSSLVIIYIIVSAILLNGIIVKQTINHHQLQNEIEELKIDTSTKINELSNTLLETKTEVKKSKKDISLLKASASEGFSDIIEESIESVVTIKTDFGQGTGFVIQKEGFIITNAHVLTDYTGYLAPKINALTYKQESLPANFIGYNAKLDLALLKVDETFDALELENSEEIKIGEKVIAIGNPLGLQFSVSEGIVSAVHRRGLNNLEAYIQTDTALNPGNSGGPLINKEGKVIGINNFKVGGENLGFALESNYVKDAINEISEKTLNQSLLG